MLKLLFIEHLYTIVGLCLFSWLPNYIIRYVTIILSTIFFNHCLLFLVLFNSFYVNYQFEWMTFMINFDIYTPLLKSKLRFGVDGLSIFFILVTGFMLPGALLYSKHYLHDVYLNLYIIILFLLNLLLYCFFTVLNFLFFYVCFEFILIPIFFLIIFWGPRYKRSLAGIYMFMYTFIGSLFFFIFLVLLYLSFRTYDFEQIFVSSVMPISNQQLYWILCFLTFAVKVPMMPVHLWLPEAHVEAPTVGSVYLASLLLKLGGYGLIRITYQWLQGAFSSDIRIFGQLVTICSFIYCSILIFSQVDLKKIIAYSSIIHMNFALFGLFCPNIISVFGCIYMLLGHSLISGALFYLVGMLYDRTKSRLIFDYSSLSLCMPLWSFFFFFFSISNAGFPGTVNFISELFIATGVILYSNVIHINILSWFIILGLFFGIWYSLLLVNRLLFGGVFKGWVLRCLVTDITLQEVLVLLPIFILTIYFGLSSTLISNNILGYCDKATVLYTFSFIFILPFKSLENFFLKIYSKNNELFILLLPNALLKVATYLKYSSYLAFDQIIDIVGLDASNLTKVYVKDQVTLVSLNLILSTLFNIRTYVWVWGVTPLPSLEDLYFNATWAERENWDLFGLWYSTRDLRRILTNYGFVGYPLRKNFPLIGFIEFYFNIALGCIMDRKVDQTQGFRFYTVNDLWWPNVSLNNYVILLTAIPNLVKVENLVNFEIIYIILLIYVIIFILLPYIRNLVQGLLLVALAFLFLVFTLLYIGYEFTAALILILYMGSILLVALYVIAVLNNGVLQDSTIFNANSTERWIFLLVSVKFIFFSQFLFSYLKVPKKSVEITTEYFQTTFSVIDETQNFSQFFTSSEFLLYTLLISLALILTIIVLTLIASGWRYLNIKARWY